MLRTFILLLALVVPALAQAPADTARLILLQQQLSLAKTNQALANRSWDGLVNQYSDHGIDLAKLPTRGSTLIRGQEDWPIALEALDGVSIKLYGEHLGLDQSPQHATTMPKVTALISRIEAEIKSIEGKR